MGSEMCIRDRSVWNLLEALDGEKMRVLERLGCEGREEGVSVSAVALIYRE